MSPAIYLLLPLWLEVGYAAVLVRFSELPLRSAAWQAAACIAAIIPLLACVLYVLGASKRISLRSRAATLTIFALTDAAQFSLPWAGWTVLLGLMNGMGMSWAGALRGGTAITGFSYLTGLALIIILRPRPGDVVVSRVCVPVEGLPRAFDGYRIMHLSDLHAGIFPSVEEIRRRLARAKSLEADLTVLTGDISGGRLAKARAIVETVSGMKGQDGIVAVLGNHDNWMGAEQVAKILSGAGVTVLVNSNMVIRRGDDRIYLAGVDEAAYGDRDDLEASMAGIPNGAIAILLSHAPDILRKPLSDEVKLVLAGHTHGGQIALPGIGPLYVPSRMGRRYASGLHRVAGRWLFVTRGVGEVFPPLRIGCPPEIALVTLRRTATIDTA